MPADLSLFRHGRCWPVLGALLWLVGCGGGGGGADGTEAPSSAAASPPVVDASNPPTTQTAVTGGNAAGTTDTSSPGTALAALTAPPPAPAPAPTPTLTLRVRADLAGGVGPVLQVRINGVAVASFEVKSTSWTQQSVTAPGLAAGANVDVVFTNDAVINGQDRNLYLGHLASGDTVVLPAASGHRYDRGGGDDAFDGIDTLDGRGELHWSERAAADLAPARHAGQHRRSA